MNGRYRISKSHRDAATRCREKVTELVNGGHEGYVPLFLPPTPPYPALNGDNPPWTFGTGKRGATIDYHVHNGVLYREYVAGGIGESWDGGFSTTRRKRIKISPKQVPFKQYFPIQLEQIEARLDEVLARARKKHEQLTNAA
ncbi:MAG: hypothetical protein HYY37_05705 [Candidatus Aenigmarchaeota archaeon]|nr:hypothetical protein [Candidatus Aenigmarchaeota archaeon]